MASDYKGEGLLGIAPKPEAETMGSRKGWVPPLDKAHAHLPLGG